MALRGMITMNTAAGLHRSLRTATLPLPTAATARAAAASPRRTTCQLQQQHHQLQQQFLRRRFSACSGRNPAVQTTPALPCAAAPAARPFIRRMALQAAAARAPSSGCCALPAVLGLKRGPSLSSSFSSAPPEAVELSEQQYHHKADHLLEGLFDAFEDLLDVHPDGQLFDLSLANGVLTLALGEHGTYVINKQVPNRQIWFSSPISGPKRYDFCGDPSVWVYKHDGIALLERLQEELTLLLSFNVELKLDEL